MTRYRTIVADPPWTIGNPGATKANASRHYALMTTQAIAHLPVLDLAEDSCHLWLWGVNAALEDAYWVVRSWGFRPLTVLTWCKRQPGVGFYLRNNTEHCILASRGKPMVPEAKPLASWFVWPRAEHSKKPDAFYDLVESVSPEPRLEMFSRRARLGWDGWGDQALEHVDLATSEGTR